MRTNNEMSVMLDHGMSISGHERNCVFLNTGADVRAVGRFACVSAVSGLDFPDDGRAVSVVDWDRDGDQDLWISNRNAPRLRFMRNDTAAAHNFISLLLVGNGTTTTRDAIGARVELVLRESRVESQGLRADDDSGASGSQHSTLNSRPLIKTLRAGEGFLAQSSKWLHFGLGSATEIAKVTVHWPRGELEEFTNLKTNGRYELVQGGGIEEVQLPADPPPVLASSVPELPPPADRFRVPLVALLPMPDLPFIDASGETKTLLSAAEGALLINCWSTTCAPCLKELEEFTIRADEIRDAGIQILAISLDPPADIGSATAAPESVLKEMGFPFATGRATLDLGMALNTIHNVMTATGGQLPVPTSFLVDSSGRLAAIYKGPVSVDALLADAEHSSLSPWERFRRSANLPGRLIENEILGEALVKGDRFARTRLAHHLQELGWSQAASIQYEELARNLPESEEKRAVLGNVLLERGILLAKQMKWAEAAAAFQRSIDNRADSAKAHYNLGIAYQRLGQPYLARQQYEQAIDIQPELVSAHANLARLLAKEKKWSQAATHFEHVVRARPDDEESHYNLGVMLAKQDKWQQAAEHFQAALRLRPEFPKARIYLDRVRGKMQ